MKKFILDTNVLLYDPKALEIFEDNEIIIPLTVLDELDNAKVRPDEVGRNARSVVRLLDDLRTKGSLHDGINLGGSIVKVELNHRHNIPEGLSPDKNDNRLISTALGLQKEGQKVILVTKDINLRVKCDALGIEAQDYVKDKITDDIHSIYSGTEVLEVSSGLIDSLYSDGFTVLEGLAACPNQFFILKSGSQSAITIYKKNGMLELCRIPKDVWGIIPRNAEQKMAFKLLLDPNIKIVTMTGSAGCGKTLLACAAALQQVINSPDTYTRILISRPIQPMGRDLGYLPGDIEDKLKPWLQPIYDNLDLLLGSDQHMLNEYKYNGLLQVEPLTYIRGRSIPKSFMILDESQNLTSKEVKTIITRMGEDSKIVITGDIEQIDNPYIDFADNGLTHVVERFKDYNIAGHITLRKGERSELATLASKIL